MRDADTDAGRALSPFEVAVFRDPPRELGPHVRWWWPGGAVDDATITAQLDTIAAAGFAGIELQTLSFGMSAADADDPRVRSVGQPEYLEHVRTFLREARARSLRTSLTLGSGWPSGGTFSQDIRPLELLFKRVDVDGDKQLSLDVPTPDKPSWVDRSNALFPVSGRFHRPSSSWPPSLHR